MTVVWIIAALPLWVAGVGAAAEAFSGFYMAAKSGATEENPMGVAFAFTVLLVFSTLCLYLAARMVS